MRSCNDIIWIGKEHRAIDIYRMKVHIIFGRSEVFRLLQISPSVSVVMTLLQFTIHKPILTVIASAVFAISLPLIFHSPQAAAIPNENTVAITLKNHLVLVSRVALTFHDVRAIWHEKLFN